VTSKFIPRTITPEQAARGYNNEGRGELLGYIAVPADHEMTCRYRITTKGDPDRTPHESCTCRVGLWQEKPARRAPLKTGKKTRTVVAVRKTKKRK
jgi:hypothetical protein